MPTTFGKRGFSPVHCTALVFFLNKDVFFLFIFYVPYSLIPLPFLFLRLSIYIYIRFRVSKIELFNFSVSFHPGVCLPIGSLFYVLVTLSHKQHRVVSCWGVDTGILLPRRNAFGPSLFFLLLLSIYHRTDITIFPGPMIFLNFSYTFKIDIVFYVTRVHRNPTNFTYHGTLPYYRLSTELNWVQTMQFGTPNGAHLGNVIHSNWIPMSYRFAIKIQIITFRHLLIIFWYKSLFFIINMVFSNWEPIILLYKTFNKVCI